MLNYLKYSHLDFFNEPTRKTGIGVDKATQFPETRNQSTQTIERLEKGVDTYDDLNPMMGEYILQTDDKNFNNNEKMVQATSVRVNQNDDSPPDSGDSNDEGFVSKNVRRGFRLAEFALNTAIVGTNATINIADSISDFISPPHQSSSEDEENNPEVISVSSSQPHTINSSQPQTINSSSSAPTPTSMPAPTSPNPSTPASSAKTTPRKNLNNINERSYIEKVIKS